MVLRVFNCCGKGDGAAESVDDQAEPARIVKPANKQRTSLSSDALPILQEAASESEEAEDVSLWDIAYGRLDKDLREEYENLLSTELAPKDVTTPGTGLPNDSNQGSTKSSSRISNDPKIRAAQLEEITARGTERIRENRTSYEIFGHEFVLEEQIADAAEFLLWGKGLVDEAVTASTGASLAWAGVSLVLPLLTYPREASEANEAGFAYVTACMRHYTGLEHSLLGAPTHTTEDTSISLSENIVNLYRAILEYQLKTVLRVYKSSFRRWIGDVLQLSIWKEMIEYIEKLVNDLHIKLQEIQNSAMIAILDDIRKDTATTAENATKQLQVSKEQLDVLKETRDIERSRYNLEKYGMKIDHNAMYDGAEVGSNACQSGTRTSILKEITDWVNGGASQSVFWLNGPAGMGKSTIAQSISRHFAASGQLGGTYFFKGSAGRSKADLFVPTIASALIHSIPPLAKYVYKSIDSHRSPVDKEGIEKKALSTQFETLIFEPLEAFSRDYSIVWTRVLVIDAFDECDNDEDKRIICQWLFKICQNRHIRLRILLTSQDQTPIGPALREREGNGTARIQSILDVNNSKSDIRAYLEECMANIKKDRDDYEEPWPLPEDVDSLFSLASNPSPLFVFVATFYRSVLADTVELLQDQVNRWLERKHEQSQLAKTYGPVMHRVLSELKMKQVLSAILLLASPLSCQGLANLLSLKKLAVETLVKKFGAVLYVAKDNDKTIRVLHTTFHDYLLQSATFADINFGVDKQATHRMLAENCVALLERTLKPNICAFKDPDTRIKDVKREELARFIPPEAQYACLHWVEHIDKGGAPFIDANEQFLRTHFLHWLEAMAWIGEMSKAIAAITTLMRIAMTRKPAILNLMAFIHDMRRFTMYARSSIEEAPLRIYHGAAAFAPSNSLVRQEFLRLQGSLPNTGRVLVQQCGVSGHWSALLYVFAGHSRKVSTLAYSTKAKLLASCGDDSTIRIWDPAMATCQQTLKGHSGPVLSVSFSPDGHQLASVSLYGELKLWDVSVGDALYTRSVSGSGGKATCVAISRSGTLLATGSTIGEIQLRKTDTGEISSKLLQKSRNSPIQTVAFSPREDIIASIDQNGALSVWNVSSMDQLWETDSMLAVWNNRFSSAVTPNMAISFSSDGMTLAVTRGDGPELFNTTTGKYYMDRILRSRDSFRLQSLAFSPSEPHLLVLEWRDGKKQLLRTTPGNMEDLGRIRVPSQGPQGSNIIFLEGRQLATTNWSDHTITIWDGISIEWGESASNNYGTITSVKVSPDSTSNLVASGGRSVLLWDSANCSLDRELVTPSPVLFDVEFSPDGKLVAASSKINASSVWTSLTGALYNRIEMKDRRIEEVHFSPHGPLFLSADKFGRGPFKLHNLKTRTSIDTLELEELTDHFKNGQHFFSLDGQNLAVASFPKVNIYDTTSAKRNLELLMKHAMGGETGSITVTKDSEGKYEGNSKEPIGKIRYVAFSPDGKTIACTVNGGQMSGIHIWDLNSKASPKHLALELRIMTLAVSTNGLLAGVMDNWDVILWNTVDMEEVGRVALGRPAVQPWDIFFSRDNSFLMTSRGVLNVKPLSVRLAIQNCWISRGAEKLVCLPAEYNPTSSDYQAGRFAFCDGSSRVTILDCRHLSTT